MYRLQNRSDLHTCLSRVSGEKNITYGAWSRDGQAAQATSSQQLQQDDTVETFRQKYLSSGKFHFTSSLGHQRFVLELRKLTF